MKTEKNKKNYKDSLNLPRTSFSMKANLPNREPEILKKWEDEGTYRSILKKNSSGSGKNTFILHDGPPYANGHLHMGHVLNKTLKDICVKYYSMRGYFAPYVPGWDCHGLPVEHKLLKELKKSKHDIDQVEFREKAYKYAMKFVKIQTAEFKRLGVFGEWNDPYLTLSKDYESDILLALADMYEKGFIYKDLKPVNWCTSCETALAEAEVEYADKESPSLFCAFPSSVTVEGKDLCFLVWTTTPWTLMANTAIALHPAYEYSLVSTGGRVLVMLSELVDSLCEKLGFAEYKVIEKLSGEELSSRIPQAEHPILERKSRIVLADYVTSQEGTGCVHTAPGHGQDDYLTGKKYGLPVIMPVDDKGCFTHEAGDLSGMDVLKANKDIVLKLKKNGNLVECGALTHSYPHCWRCKQPVIFRATEQWFLSIDHRDLRSSLLENIENSVKWVPSAGKERITSMVTTRPDWCLSRQRMWGVPIPAFKCNSCSAVFTDASLIRRIAELTRKKGSNIWFSASVEDLLPEGAVCRECGSSDLLKENDILDVWFDSGVSHKAVLDARQDLSSPADMYLEGSDQHRGWFQSSLITSVAMNGDAPYREVLTHGFVVDGEGKKMSKSLGNVISPLDVMRKYGADILRLWTASSDYEGDIKLSEEILQRLADGYRKIRNTFRFLLSNLNDFEPGAHVQDHGDLSETDRWMLAGLYSLVEKVTEAYESRQYHKVYRAVYGFCVEQISSFYLDVSKDILYVDAPGSTRRRSVQTVLYYLLDTLCRLMAPVMPFTMEEVWSHLSMSEKCPSVHMADWPDMEALKEKWGDDGLRASWARLLSLREKIMKSLETKREEGLIGSSLDARLCFFAEDPEIRSYIDRFLDRIPLLFKVSQAEIKEVCAPGMEDVGDFPLKLGVEKARGEKCQRCWNYSQTVGDFAEYEDLCERCFNIVAERSGNG